jgi:hypothetical protein
MPVSAYTAQVGVLDNKKIHQCTALITIYVTLCHSVYIFLLYCRLKINHITGFSNVHLFLNSVWSQTIKNMSLRQCCGSRPFDMDPDPLFNFDTTPDIDPEPVV